MMHPVATGTAKQFQNALDKAAKQQPLERVTRLGERTYRVASPSGESYTLVLTRDGLVCSCRAAERSVLCWHLAAVHLANMSAQSFGESLPVRAERDSSTAVPSQTTSLRHSGISEFDDVESPW